MPHNVPSTPMPMPSSLPKPVLRLAFLATLLLSSILLLTFVPAARLPSLKAASASRRLALDADGKAYLDVSQRVGSWADERVRAKEYQPPQVKVAHMLKRSIEEKAAPAPNPKATRPIHAPRPLPSSHELLALQSYLLSSAYNVLPEQIDPSKPLDANAVLGVASHKLGPSGSDAEKAWLSDLEGEWSDEVVVWYGGDGKHHLPHAALDILASVHGSSRHPTLIPCHARSDRPALLSILDRLALPLKRHPIVMIGHEPIVADPETLEELLLSGELEAKLAKIGWKKEAKVNWKPKMAVVKKREFSEVERALDQAV